MTAPAMVAGLDGCAGGWVVVTTSTDADHTSTVERVSDLGVVVARLDRGELAAAGIDIPIGLPGSAPRRCDIEARLMIGPRRSSVFPAPGRDLLEAETYEEAAACSRALYGKGLSRQAFGILPKVRDVDRLMTPRRQRHLVEVHPEASFTAMSGGPMTHAKKTSAGRAERLESLCAVFRDVDVHAGTPLAGTRPDDILDAFAVAWSAHRWLSRSHIRLGAGCDARGLRMEIIV
jgi:predicted RNase H-like nuclease